MGTRITALFVILMVVATPTVACGYCTNPPSGRSPGSSRRSPGRSRSPVRPIYPPYRRPPTTSPKRKPPIILPPVVNPPVIINPPVVVNPPVDVNPPVVNPPVIEPPPTYTPSPPSGGLLPHPSGGVPSLIPPPATTPPTCSVDMLKLGLCVDVLGGLVHVGLGDPVANACCPVLGGLLELEAAVCLCTAIKLKLLNINIYIPLALQVLITCGKNPPPGVCPPL